jgi:hypothetical protein
MLRRLFPMRWARIAAWTGAALAWGTTAIAVASNAGAEAPTEPSVAPQAIEPPASTSTTTTTVAPLPELPARGLVVVRYTPIPPPPPQVVTRTVVVAGSSTGGTSASATAPATAAVPAPPVSAPVQSAAS